MTNEETLHSVVAALKSHGEAIAVVEPVDDEFTTHRFTELDSTVRRMAAGLAARGLGAGTPVAIWASNRSEWVVSLLAIIAADGIAVPIDRHGDAERVAHAVHDSGCRALLTTASLAKQAGAVITEIETFVFDDDIPDGTAPWTELLGPEPAPLPPAPDPDAVAITFYTSGTTGPSKGVQLTHRNVMTSIAALKEFALVGPGDRLLVPLPLHHVFPCVVGVLAPLYCGAAVVFPAGIGGRELVAAVRHGKASVIIGVPRLYAALLDGISGRVAARGPLARSVFSALLVASDRLRRHLGLRTGRRLFATLHREIGPDLRLLVSGGAHLEAGLHQRLEALGWDVLTGYGLTETAPILAFNRPGRARAGSAGEVVADVTLRIAAEEGERAGEIQARGPNVFPGYLGDPERTAASFTEDGWFRTGDLGYVDPDGFLYVVGRVKDALVLADGTKVMPEDLEKTLAVDPIVGEVAMLERDGRLVALAVPDATALRERGTSRANETVREAIREAAARLPVHQRPVEVVVIHEALPRTELGKLQRHLLVNLLDGASRREKPAGPSGPVSDEDRELLEQPITQTVLEWLRQRYSGPTIGLGTSPQIDLGVDSLEWTVLTLELERRTGVVLDTDAVSRILTVRDLVREAEAAASRDESGEPVTASESRFRPRSRLSTGAAAAIFAVVRLLVRTAYRLRVEGEADLPRGEPLVLAPNHTSYLDPIVLVAALPRNLLDRTYWAGWVGILFTSLPRRILSRILGILPIDPDRAPLEGLATCRAVLTEERVLVWFPEGQRSRDGTLQPFMPGIARLIEDSPARVIPVVIEGTFAAWPRDRRWPRLGGTIRVRFGEPLAYTDIVADAETETDPASVAAALRSRHVALLSPAGQG